jgi:hypothetical protein
MDGLIPNVDWPVVNLDRGALQPLGLIFCIESCGRLLRATTYRHSCRPGTGSSPYLIRIHVGREDCTEVNHRRQLPVVNIVGTHNQ